MPESRPFRPATGWSPVDPRRVSALGFVAFAALSLASVAGVLPNPYRPDSSISGPIAVDVAARAARAEDTMRAARDLLRRQKIAELGDRAEIEPSGLIGAELTPLVTTLGSLEAKRLSTSPAWARVLTVRLAARGIGPGSLVAASFSGSFPGLNVALAAACDALGARLLAVSSVTASTWGANQPGFTWPEMEARLVQAGIIRRASIAVTAGGEGDRAQDLPDEDRVLAERIRDDAAASLGVPALRPASYEDAVAARLRAYRRAASGAPIVLYANVGGAEASMGRSAAILNVGTGFVDGQGLAGKPGGGVTARFAAERVTILMLLNIRELALRWGI